LAIVFFTDGQGGYSDDVKYKLEVALAQTGFTTEIHTIGFTGDHDAGKFNITIILILFFYLILFFFI